MKASPSSLVALIGVCVAASGCAQSTTPRATAPNEHALAAERTLLVGEPVQTTLDDPTWSMADRILPGPVFACTRDDDCEVIQLDCCDSCEGGRRLAVNRTQIEHANAAWRDDGCADAICEPLTCAQTLEPLCDGGVCARREESTNPDGTLEATIVRNELPVR